MPLRIPEGGESWHSGMLGLTAGTRFEHRFQVEGVYDYFCQPHYHFGMVGRIVVGGARGGPAIRRPLAELPESSQRQMPPVETVTEEAGRTFEWTARLNGPFFSDTKKPSSERTPSSIETVFLFSFALRLSSETLRGSSLIT